MFDIGMTELLLVGIVALIVVGPKDLPRMFHTVGRFTGKAKGMAREFSRAMNDAAESTGVNDLGKDLRDATSHNSLGLKQLDDIADRFDKWTPDSDGEKYVPKTDPSAKLSDERIAEAKRDHAEAFAKAAEQGKAAAGSGAKSGASAKTAAKTPAKKPAKKTAGKTAKNTAKKPAAKPAAKSAAANKPAAKLAAKPAAKKPAAKKPAKKPAPKPAAKSSDKT